MSPQDGELGPLAAEIRPVVWGHPSKFQRASRLGSVTARHSSSGRQPNFAALNRGRHLCSTGRPSRWALVHILLFSEIILPNFERHEVVGLKVLQAERAPRRTVSAVIFDTLTSPVKKNLARRTLPTLIATDRRGYKMLLMCRCQVDSKYRATRVEITPIARPTEINN